MKSIKTPVKNIVMRFPKETEMTILLPENAQSNEEAKDIEGDLNRLRNRMDERDLDQMNLDRRLNYDSERLDWMEVKWRNQYWVYLFIAISFALSLVSLVLTSR